MSTVTWREARKRLAPDVVAELDARAQRPRGGRQAGFTAWPKVMYTHGFGPLV